MQVVEQCDIEREDLPPFDRIGEAQVSKEILVSNYFQICGNLEERNMMLIHLQHKITFLTKILAGCASPIPALLLMQTASAVQEVRVSGAFIETSALPCLSTGLSWNSQVSGK